MSCFGNGFGCGDVVDIQVLVVNDLAFGSSVV